MTPEQYDAWLAFARRRSPEQIRFVQGDAVCLPFEDRSFEKVMSVTALCFVQQWPRAIAGIVYEGNARELADDPQVQRAYPGI